MRVASATRILHRKRPDLVLIFDSKVAGYHLISTNTPWMFWPVPQSDIRTNAGILDDLRAQHEIPEGRPMSCLRELDIIVWEHQIRD